MQKEASIPSITPPDETEIDKLIIEAMRFQSNQVKTVKIKSLYPDNRPRRETSTKLPELN